MNEGIDILVSRYSNGGNRLADSMTGMDQELLHRVPPADAPGDIGRWSIQQIVIHLADAEASFADRIKRIIAMDEPALLSWDEGHFAERLHYDDQSAADAVEGVRLIRRQMGRVLCKCDESVFKRVGIHSQRGPQKLDAVVRFTDWHLDHHIEFIARKRHFFEK